MINTDALHELVRDHRTFITRADGTREAVYEMSLLEQLHEARTVGNKGGGSAGGSKSPVSLAAVDLWNEIAEVSGRPWPGHAPRLASQLPDRVQAWANQARGNDSAERFVNGCLATWCKQIRGMAYPTVELDAPCPECGEVFLLEQDAANPESVIRKRVLTFNPERASCRMCETTWEGYDGMRHLAGLLDNAIP